MFNILLLDADSENIKNFRSFLRSYNNGGIYKIVGTVSDAAKDVLELIKISKARLLLADIRFFGNSGVKMISDINKSYPKVKFILYGAYADGDYIRSCKEYGLIDSMYKPLKPADLTRCLDTAAEFFQQENKTFNEEQNIIKKCGEEKYLYRNIFLNNLVNGNIRNEKEVKYSLNYFDIDLDSGFTVFTLRIDHFKKLVLTLDEMEKHVLIHKMMISVNDKLRGYKFEAFVNSFNSISGIIGGYYDLYVLIDVCDQIKEEVLAKTKIRVSIGIGRTYDKPTDLYISYKEAAAALRYRFHVGYNSVIPIHFVEPLNKITYRYPIDKEERLIYTTVVGEYAYCHTLLRDLFNALRECEPLPDKLLSKIVMDILISINRYLSEKNMPMTSNFTTFFPSKDVLLLKDLDSAFSYLDGALKNFCEYILQLHIESDKKLIEDTKAYIAVKYYESFSLQKMAVNLGTTPEYLNKTFISLEGIQLFDYMVKVRLGEAKKLMRETEFEDDMVAIKIGYDDGRHFRSVFKQYENMNTNDYRAQFSLYSHKSSLLIKDKKIPL